MIPGDFEDGPSEVDDNTESGGAEERGHDRVRRAREAYRSKKKYWMIEGTQCTPYLQATTTLQRTTNDESRTTKQEPRTKTHDHHYQSWLS